jgi:hypothetical protein
MKGRLAGLIATLVTLTVISAAWLAPGTTAALRVPPPVGEEIVGTSFHPALGNTTLEVLTGFDRSGFVPSTNFNTGLWTGENEVYFYILDLNSTPTTSANVTILDPNATRDGLANPVWTDTVTLTDGIYNSVLANPPVGYVLDESLAMGGTWILQVTTETPTPQKAEAFFQVHTYYVEAEMDQAYHVPGEQATLFYHVLSYRTNGPVTNLSSVAVSGCFSNATVPSCGVALPGFPGLGPNASGSVNFTVPSTATVGTLIDLEVFANMTAGGTVYSETGSVSFTVVEPLSPPFCASLDSSGGPLPCPANMLTFPGGSSIVLHLTAPVGTGPTAIFGELPAAPVDFGFSFQGVNQSPPTSFPTQVETGPDGSVRVVLDTAGMKLGLWEIRAQVEDPQNPQYSASSSLGILLEPPSTQVLVEVHLGSGSYSAGTNLTGNFQLVATGGGNPTSASLGGWTAYAELITEFPANPDCGSLPSLGTRILFQTNLSGISGELPAFPITPLMGGSLGVVVLAHNTTATGSGVMYGSACVPILAPSILLNPSETDYRPGDTISVTITPLGAIFTQVPILYYITVSGTVPGGTSPIIITQENISGTQFSFQVPSEGTLPRYTLSVTAQGPHGVVAGQSLTLTEVTGFVLRIGLQTLSHYSDGSYQPGQTVVLSYSLVSVGIGPLPTRETLELIVGSSPTRTLETTDPNGTLSFQIPSGQPAGFLWVTLSANLDAPGTNQTLSASTGVLVNPNPPFLDFEVVPGSGLTVAILLLIALVIVVAVILAVRNRRPPGLRGGPRHFQEWHAEDGRAIAEGEAPSPSPAGASDPPVQEPPKVSASGVV